MVWGKRTSGSGTIIVTQCTGTGTRRRVGFATTLGTFIRLFAGISATGIVPKRGWTSMEPITWLERKRERLGPLRRWLVQRWLRIKATRLRTLQYHVWRASSYVDNALSSLIYVHEQSIHRSLSLDSNNLSGSIPEIIGRLTALT
jgi:hypothetical protein